MLLKENTDGIIIRIDVVINFELEREILGFGGVFEGSCTTQPYVTY